MTFEIRRFGHLEGPHPLWTGHWVLESSRTDAQDDLSQDVSVLNPAVCLDHVFQRKYLDPQRDRSRTNGSIQANERFMRHGAIKCRPGMATEMRFGLDAIGIGKRRPCFQMG